ncbi:MAG: hypothetical protein WC865_16275 [Bacteroidales bacterium]
MDSVYRNKYRLKSTRLSTWDYGSHGKYFVTICTDKMIPYFGTIEDSGLIKTDIGDFVSKCWESIPRRLDWNPNQFGPQSQNLASVIRGFKGAVKSFAMAHSIEFHWQPRYYDRIIRNDQGLNQIREYIRDNPRNWSKT